MFSVQIGQLFYGLDPPDCPLPCRTFSTEIKFSSKWDELVGFGLYFLPTVEVDKVPLLVILSISCDCTKNEKVTKTEMMTPTFVNFMSDVRYISKTFYHLFAKKLSSLNNQEVIKFML